MARPLGAMGSEARDDSYGDLARQALSAMDRMHSDPPKSLPQLPPKNIVEVKTAPTTNNIDNSNQKFEVKLHDNRADKIEQMCIEMEARQREFCQCRSNHQIEKFIACEEYSPITRYRHVGHNSYVALQEVRRLFIEKERLLRKISRLESLAQSGANTDNPDWDLDKLEALRRIPDIEIRISGLLKEIDLMEKICKELEKQNGKPFTAEQLQAEEPEYWRKRFANQMLNEKESHITGVGQGNLMSYRMSLEQPILPDSKQYIENPFNYHSIDELGTAALSSRKRLDTLFLKSSPKEIKE